MILRRLKSKTYWLGIGTFILGALEVAQATGTLPELFSGEARAGITLATALAIFVLRELTHQPISEK